MGDAPSGRTTINGNGMAKLSPSVYLKLTVLGISVTTFILSGMYALSGMRAHMSDHAVHQTTTEQLVLIRGVVDPAIAALRERCDERLGDHVNRGAHDEPRLRDLEVVLRRLEVRVERLEQAVKP